MFDHTKANNHCILILRLAVTTTLSYTVSSSRQTPATQFVCGVKENTHSRLQQHVLTLDKVSGVHRSWRHCNTRSMRGVDGASPYSISRLQKSI